MVCKPVPRNHLLSQATVAFCIRMASLCRTSLAICPGVRPEAAAYAVSHMELLDDVVGQACAEDQNGEEEDDKGKVLGTDVSPPCHRFGGSIVLALGFCAGILSCVYGVGGAANMAGTSYICSVQRSVHI